MTSHLTTPPVVLENVTTEGREEENLKVVPESSSPPFKSNPLDAHDATQKKRDKRPERKERSDFVPCIDLDFYRD